MSDPSHTELIDELDQLVQLADESSTPRLRLRLRGARRWGEMGSGRGSYRGQWYVSWPRGISIAREKLPSDTYYATGEWRITGTGEQRAALDEMGWDRAERYPTRSAALTRLTALVQRELQARSRRILRRSLKLARQTLGPEEVERICAEPHLSPKPEYDPSDLPVREGEDSHRSGERSAPMRLEVG